MDSGNIIKTRLHRAAFHRTPEQLESEIIAAGGTQECVNYKDDFGRSTFLHAAYSGEVAKLQICWKYGADLESTDNYQRSALHLAAKKDHVQAVHYLLLLGMNVNARDNYGRQPHHLAALKGAAETLEILIQRPDVNIHEVDNWGHTPLYLANYYQHNKALGVLLKCGAHYGVGKWSD